MHLLLAAMPNFRAKALQIKAAHIMDLTDLGADQMNSCSTRPPGLKGVGIGECHTKQPNLCLDCMVEVMKQAPTSLVSTSQVRLGCSIFGFAFGSRYSRVFQGFSL